jgi:RraA family protein
MKNIGYSISLDYKRPDKALVELFRGIPVANIDDCMNRTAAVDGAIRPLNRTPLLGTAFTVQVPEGDNLMFHKAMDMAKPGDVIVIDAGGSTSRSIFGSLMINYCKVRGLAGVIVDGAIRDYDELAALDFPVYAKGVTPNGPYKNGPGEINTPIAFGGRVVCPGDIVVGDGDGILFIKPEEARELAEKAQAVVEKEAKILDNILNHHSYIRPWVDEMLEKAGCEYL